MAGDRPENFKEYTLKKEFDRAVHTLEGLIKGIAIDGVINEKEKTELSNWINRNIKLLNYETFREITPILNGLYLNKNINEEDRKDILWLCNNFRTKTHYYDIITSDIYRLEGILHGILADNVITEKEIVNLEKWIAGNSQMRGLYPYDELESLLAQILRDKIITPDEKKFLKVFISQFVDLGSSGTIDGGEIEDLKKAITIGGICAVNPRITIKKKLFCFTGKSSRALLPEIIDMIEAKDGLYNNQIMENTDYLVVGSEGENQVWAFSHYGRKIEEAVNLRKKGSAITIVHENDFWQALDPK